jgi:hypothetical protein
MDNKDNLGRNAEKFYEDIKETHDEMHEKLYANIPIPVDDPKYFKKANAYLNELGIESILRLLGFDKIEEAKLIWEGLHAKRYNHYVKEWEPDPKTILSYMNHVSAKIKQEKKEKETKPSLDNNNITYIPPDWFDVDKILEGKTHGEGWEAEEKRIKEKNGQPTDENTKQLSFLVSTRRKFLEIIKHDTVKVGENN